MKNQAQKKGISLIALIITIIVIVLLAAIVVNTAITTPQSANFAKFASDMGELQQAVTLTYFDIYATETIKPTPRTDAEIYKEIAGGTEYGTSLPTGIDGKEAWLVANADRLNSVDTLPYADLYITDTGTIFRKSGYENNGEIFLTPSVKVGEVIDVPVNAGESAPYNPPTLVKNLIPVYYDNGWKKADSTNANNQWYKYDTTSKKWANAVTVTQNKRSTYTSASVGTLIPESDIIGMFVWIPRYAYKITSGYQNGGTSVNGSVDIKFLKGTTDTSADGNVAAIRSNVTNEANYVVHPAFTNGASTNYKNGEWSKEITGFWVAKFEASEESAKMVQETATFTDGSTSTGYTTTNGGANYGGGNDATKKLTIRPNVTSWRNITMKNIAIVCEALTSSGNIHGLSSILKSHIMKNSEWGAVAYLTQSSYGNMQTTSGTSGVWNNSYAEGDSTNNGKSKYCTTITGMVGESRDNNTDYYSYKLGKKYNDDGTITITYQRVNSSTGEATTTFTNTYSRYETAKGQKGSTTGNIYGIYDMAGGAYECVASLVNNGHANVTNAPGVTSVTNATSNSLLQVYKATTMWSSDASYDAALERTDNCDYTKNIEKVYGDAIGETSRGTPGSYAWNGEISYFPNSGSIFFIRGGYFSFGSEAGLFHFNSSGGSGASSYSFRPVLSAM